MRTSVLAEIVWQRGQRKNLETFTETMRIALKAAQTVARRQPEPERPDELRDLMRNGNAAR